MNHRFRLLRMAALGLWLSALVVSAPRPGAAQQIEPSAPERLPGKLTTLYAAQYDAFTRVPPPAPRLAPAAATFVVTYNGFSAQAQTAFQSAVDVWAGQIDSTVPIKVQANWTPLGAGVLGSAGASSLWRNFRNAPADSTFVSDALADKLFGSDINSGNPGAFDIIANFNSSFGSWYLGTNGATPAGQYDLKSVVLHELGHGLGFAGSATVSGGNGSWGLGTPTGPIIYDRFAVNGSGQRIIDTATFPNPSAALATQLQSNNLFFNGEYARAANGGTSPRLYAPSGVGCNGATGWSQGSSYSHLDDSTFPAGNANSLMTPCIGTAEAIHSPGPVTLGLFKDLGWFRDDLVIQAFGYGTSQVAEWVQIRNNAAAAVNLSDYAIGDEEQGGGTESMFLLPNVSLASGASLTMRISRDTASWPYSTPNPTYCWNCSSGYTNLTPYTVWTGSSAVGLDNTGDEIILLKTNGGISDPDGRADDVMIDGVCYVNAGAGWFGLDIDANSSIGGREPVFFTDNACLLTSGATNGSFRRSNPATDTNTRADFANNPTAVTLGGISAAANGGAVLPLVLAALGCAFALAAALSRRAAVR